MLLLDDCVEGSAGRRVGSAARVARTQSIQVARLRSALEEVDHVSGQGRSLAILFVRRGICIGNALFLTRLESRGSKILLPNRLLEGVITQVV